MHRARGLSLGVGGAGGGEGWCCWGLAEPGRPPPQDAHHHHWREGNLPSGARCEVCRKTCGSSDVLAGVRCEWCGVQVGLCAVLASGGGGAQVGLCGGGGAACRWGFVGWGCPEGRSGMVEFLVGREGMGSSWGRGVIVLGGGEEWIYYPFGK